MKIAKKDNNQYQGILLEQIALKLTPEKSMVDTIADLLSISNDAAYRRIRGEKKMDISELAILCKSFDISMDTIFAINNNNLVFNYSPLNIEVQEVYLSYMRQLNNKINNIKKNENAKILFSATDIPVYHFMPFKELTLFKLFSWNSGIYNKTISFEKFINEFSNSNLYELYDSIHQNYKQINSLEIWTERTIDPVLKLIAYYREIGAFENDETYKLLYAQLKSLIENIADYSKNGQKTSTGGVYELYWSEIELDNNFVLFKTEHSSQCIVKLFAVNSISTSDQGFCEETEKWFADVIKKSKCISRISQKDNYRFMKTMMEKIELQLS